MFVSGLGALFWTVRASGVNPEYGETMIDAVDDNLIL